MPRNGSGTYSLPQPAFVPGTTISSAAVNSDLSDIATALTGSISADGQTPITGGLKITNGTTGLPALAFITDLTTGIYLASAGNLGLSSGGQGTISLSGTAIGVSDNILSYINGAIPMPVGAIMDWAGTSAPTGWLLLYGQVISQATYPGLFAICSTTYNTGGEGAGNFRLPDCRGRATFGKDNMGGSAASRITVAGGNFDGTTLGGAGGGQNHTLLQAELPNVTLTTTISAGQGSHSHTELAFQTGNQTAAGPNPPGGSSVGSTTGASTLPSMSGTTPTGGSGTAFTVLSPAIIFNKIIFAGR